MIEFYFKTKKQFRTTSSIKFFWQLKEITVLDLIQTKSKKMVLNSKSNLVKKTRFVPKTEK